MKISYEKISIIVPVYKVEKYLNRCMDSLVNQSYSNLEIILIDDGSPDSCGMICDSYAEKDERIKVIHKKNGGLSSARNAGLKSATGQYIGFVDSDDCIATDMYGYLYKLIYNNNATISMCDELAFKKFHVENIPNQIEKVRVYNNNEILKKYFRVDTSANKYFSVCYRLYRRDVLEDIKFSEGMLNEDVDFSFRVFLKSSKVIVSNLKKYYYFIGDSSITRNELSEKDMDLLTMWDKVTALTLEFRPEFLYYAKLNRIRAEFTLLCKMSRYGLDKSFSNDLQVKPMLNHLRSNYLNLMKYKGMPVNRKIILTIMCTNFSLLQILLKWFK